MFSSNEKSITADQLRQLKSEVKKLLAVKPGRTLYLKVTGDCIMYVVTRKGLDDFWTYNEDQAAQAYNE